MKLEKKVNEEILEGYELKPLQDYELKAMENFKFDNTGNGIEDFERYLMMGFESEMETIKKVLTLKVEDTLSQKSNIELNVMITMLRMKKKMFKSIISDLNINLKNPFYVGSKVVANHKINVLKSINCLIEQQLEFLKFALSTPSVSEPKFPFHVKLTGKGAQLGLFIHCIMRGEYSDLPQLTEKDFINIIKPYNLKDAKNVFQYHNIQSDKNPFSPVNCKVVKEILEELGNFPLALEYLSKNKHK